MIVSIGTLEIQKKATTSSAKITINGARPGGSPKNALDVDVKVKRYYEATCTSMKGRLNSYIVLAPPVESVPKLSRRNSRTSYFCFLPNRESETSWSEDAVAIQ